ncbi:HD domain-containing protein [Candidatus Pacearchaeota archaeon]|nr:HD domain-containing protein [Candidatus Pacearchaeota archaeon]
MKAPLYLRIKNHIFDELQVLDVSTIDWFKENQKFDEVSIFEIKKTFKPLNKNIFIKLAPHSDWFNTRSRLLSIHGKSHALRVILFTYLLCILNNISDYKKYLIAASIHDIARVSDNYDPNHGERASKWFLENKNIFCDIKKEDVEEIAISVKYHEVEYDSISTDILLKFGSMINILKCADALDRFRLPKKDWWPKKEFFKISIPEKLFDLANKLVYETESLIIKDSFDPLLSVVQISSNSRLIA